ncbi:major facilitator superfamily transporter [Colletotrichum sojae]|uniref:Major facilitator superfamily transporter n=1 Tax=Colletotrichum sojae TaxID=2175907 RepID=A0A8H6IUP5_9PEZI|nr:major facilitator superfamily transporter [Colletotrichum sojae]
MLARLLPAIGFSWSLRVPALFVFVMLLVGNITVRSRIKPVPKPVTLSDYIEPFKELPFVLLAFASCAGFSAMFVPINYIIVQAQDGGVDPNMAGYLLTIMNAGSLPGGILPGYLGDKIGRFNVMIIMCSLSAVVLLALWLPGTLLAPGSLGVYIAFAVLYGFTSGAFVGMMPALLGQILLDVRKIGVRQGVLFTCISLASLTGSPIAGAIMSQQQREHWGLQVFAGGMVVASALFFIATRVKLVGVTLRRVV